MNIIIQIKDIGPPILSAKGSLSLGHVLPHGSTLGVDQQSAMEKDHKAIDRSHSRIAIKQRLEEINETKVLLVLLVLHKLNREQESTDGEISLYDGMAIYEDHRYQAIVVLKIIRNKSEQHSHRESITIHSPIQCTEDCKREIR